MNYIQYLDSRVHATLSAALLVGPSVGPSVGRSVRPSVRPSLITWRTRLIAIGLVCQVIPGVKTQSD